MDWENIFPAVKLSLAAPHFDNAAYCIPMDLPASRKVSRVEDMMVRRIRTRLRTSVARVLVFISSTLYGYGWRPDVGSQRMIVVGSQIAFREVITMAEKVRMSPTQFCTVLGAPGWGSTCSTTDKNVFKFTKNGDICSFFFAAALCRGFSRRTYVTPECVFFPPQRDQAGRAQWGPVRSNGVKV
jgi:hypothetical protein